MLVAMSSDPTRKRKANRTSQNIYIRNRVIIILSGVCPDRGGYICGGACITQRGRDSFLFGFLLFLLAV